tara:strand:- start:373 stop:831 length:459 start_codon:yes stop_codon:yes gene_type:complete
MGNWLFLMLLYAFFGWMKKKQRDKAREKIENQEGWDTGDFVEFGEGILDSIFDGDSEKEREIADEKIILEKTKNDLNIIVEDEKNEYVPEPVLNEEKIETQDTEIETRYIHNYKRKNINVIDSLIDTKNPIKTAIILKEIFDKPRSMRRKIR